ncbi:hypothetical protein ALC53_05409, partial [Atta colombica]
LRERRRIRKINRKQINVEDDVNDPRVLAMLAMINLNPYISTRELQRNLGIPYVWRILFIVWKILQKFHLYHITLTQDISKNDIRLRRQFSLCIINSIRRHEQHYITACVRTLQRIEAVIQANGRYSE